MTTGQDGGSPQEGQPPTSTDLGLSEKLEKKWKVPGKGKRGQRGGDNDDAAQARLKWRAERYEAAKKVVCNSGVCSGSFLAREVGVSPKTATWIIQKLKDDGIVEPTNPSAENRWSPWRVVEEHLTEEAKKRWPAEDNRLAQAAKEVRAKDKAVRNERYYLRKMLRGLLSETEVLDLGRENVNLLLDLVTLQEMGSQTRAKLRTAITDKKFKEAYDRLLFDRLDLAMPHIIERLAEKAREGNMTAIRLCLETSGRRPVGSSKIEKPTGDPRERADEDLDKDILLTARAAGLDLRPFDEGSEDKSDPDASGS